MQATIRRLGNSAAILLPKPVLAHLHVSAGDALDLELEEGRVVLSPAERHPRVGWAEAAKALAQASDGELAWPQIDNDNDNVDDDDWTW